MIKYIVTDSDYRLIADLETLEQAQAVAGRVERILKKSACILTIETARQLGVVNSRGEKF